MEAYIGNGFQKQHDAVSYGPQYTKYRLNHYLLSLYELGYLNFVFLNKAENIVYVRLNEEAY